ncbi:MAG: hypothetical protein ABSB74_15510 [Tepidisphaeraceae bacterium]
MEKFDEWEEFRDGDQEPISLNDLRALLLSSMPEDIDIRVLDNYFPETTISRDGITLVCHIEDHMYTKYWEHKFSAYAFAEAMERAIRRLAHEGQPFSNPECDDEDVHIFVRWDLRLPADMPIELVIDSIKASYDLLCRRADAILENSDSILILGKDTGPSMNLLKRIAARLHDLGYFTYIIKEQPDRAGESVVQKVLRFALTARFVIVENTEPSGHLYEIPHVAKAAECVTVVLQERDKGATWMFEDAYAKHNHWHKVTYEPGAIENAVDSAVQWAEDFVKRFGAYQEKVFPWARPPAKPSA